MRHTVGGKSVTVVDWLLDSDPSVRWQVMRDLTDAPAEEVAAERARVATEGVGARLLALQGADGRWAGAAWNRGWDSTMHVLALPREMGLDPASPEARRAAGPAGGAGAGLRGQEYLRERRLFRRRSTGEVVDDAWTRFAFPTWWHYDVLRGLEHLRRAGVAPDERVSEAIGLVASKRNGD